MSLAKTAVVCGAHTEVGKFVVRELVRSPRVSLVHALAELDCRDDIHVRAHEEHKLRFHVVDLEYVESALHKRVAEADVAFCCLGSSKQDVASLGAYTFHKLNFDIPRRFISEMFAMRVQRVAILSSAGADSRSKNEFFRVKGEVVDFVSRLQAERGRDGPGVSLFKVPLLLTNMKDQNGVKGTAISTMERIKQSAALKFDMGPARAVHVRDVAKAMCAETLANADAEEENELTYMFSKRQGNFTELSGPEIVELAEETRALQREMLSRQRRSQSEQSAAIRVSMFAKEEGGFTGVTDRSSEDYGDDDPGEGHTSGPEHGDSFPNLYADDGYDSPRLSAGSQESEGANDSQSHRMRRQRHSPSGRGLEDEASARIHLDHEDAQNPVGSVESLGLQLGRPLTTIKDNKFLPDIERRPTRRRSRTRNARQAQPGGSLPEVEGGARPIEVMGSSTNGGEDVEETYRSARSMERTLGGPSHSIDSPEYGDLREDDHPLAREYSSRMGTPVLDMQTPSVISRPYEEFRDPVYRHESVYSPERRSDLRISNEKYDPSLRPVGDRSRGLAEDELNPGERLAAILNRIVTEMPSRKKAMTAARSRRLADQAALQRQYNLDTRAVGDTSI